MSLQLVIIRRFLKTKVNQHDKIIKQQILLGELKLAYRTVLLFLNVNTKNLGCKML